MIRREGLAKLTGQERYLDDLPLDNFLWGMTVRSPAPRGKIKEIRFSKEGPGTPNLTWADFTIVDHHDIPKSGSNAVRLIELDQPILAANRVRHRHEPILLLAHPDRAAVRRAVRAIEIIIEPAPPCFNYLETPAPHQIQHHPDNILKKIAIEKGDINTAFAQAHHIIEGTYSTGGQEHIYLEPQSMAAWLDENNILIITGSMQCPYYILNALTHALGRSPDQLRVIQSPTGGGFGGKEDYPSQLALHCALLALKSKRPVKIVYDRDEDIQATTKRHPCQVHHRTALDSHGRIIARDIEVIMDGGAYVTLSPVVLSRGLIHAAGPYHCENIRIRGRVMLTNRVPFGAFRGFGAPQTQFANERHMDEIAQTINLDPAELRRINLIKDGQTTATDQRINDGTDRIALLNSALAYADYENKKIEHAAFNQSHPYLRRGLGLSTIFHGSGFTGSGEVELKSKIKVHALPDGRLEVLSANTEMGQGTTTIFTAIAAEQMGYPPDEIIIATPDTSRVPNSGPTVASRTVMVVGQLLINACTDLKQKLDLDKHAKGEPLRQAIINWHKENPHNNLSGGAQYEKPPHINWNEDSYTGDAYASFAWAANVAEVEVDLRSATVRILDFVSVQEVGRVINETLAQGQIAGGVVQALGWALMEECVEENGAIINHNLTNYIIPTANDTPPIRVYFHQNKSVGNSGGSGDSGGPKGLGELPMDGPAPAILSAIARATNTNPRTIPLTPEKLLPLLPDTQVNLPN